MSWYSDGEPFDEWEGCKRCNFNKHPCKRTCNGCKSGDKWNYADWNEDEEEEEEQWKETAKRVYGTRCFTTGAVRGTATTSTEKKPQKHGEESTVRKM